MRRWVPYPFVRFVIFFVCGILAGIYSAGMLPSALLLLSICVVAYVVLQLFAYKTSQQYFALPIGICAFSILLALGYINVSLFYEKNNRNHISNLVETRQDSFKIYKATLISPLEEKEKSFGTLVRIEAVWSDSSWLAAKGKVLLYIKKDAGLNSSAFSYGDKVLLRAKLRQIDKPLNPNVFDYRSYLAHQSIFQNAFVAFDHIRIYKEYRDIGFYGAALQTQGFLAEIIKNNIEDKEAEKIILSLVLGMKDDLDKPLKDAYSSAGVIHILAVSGLHVGIIYAIFSFLLAWLNKGNTRWLFAVMCIVVLWAYAFITGLSPSVLRAVTMFSFIIIAKAFARQYNIYNAIAASAFILLCYNPFLVMSVGFQLSYTAVLGIVLLYKRFYDIFTFGNMLLDFCWKMTSVSLSAQIAVLPLSIYYFHQFPVYFLLANLIIIPAAFLMLVLGISLLLLHFVPFLGPIISAILEYLVVYANKFVYSLNTLPFHKIDGLYINEVQVLLLFAILTGLLIFISNKQFSVLVIIVLLFFGFQSIRILNHPLLAPEKKFVYYSNKATGIFGLYQGNYTNLLVTGGKDLSKEDFEYNIKPFVIKRGVDFNFETAFSEGEKLKIRPFKYGLLVVWNSKKFLVLNKEVDRNWQLDGDISIDFLIIENNAISSLNQLPSSIKFKCLIIGNSNTYKVANSLLSMVKQKDFRWAYPKEEGAFLVNFKELISR